MTDTMIIQGRFEHRNNFLTRLRYLKDLFIFGGFEKILKITDST